MQVGDLVKHKRYECRVWLGIITKIRQATKTCKGGHVSPLNRYHVEWSFGDQGWFWDHDLEVACE